MNENFIEALSLTVDNYALSNSNVNINSNNVSLNYYLERIIEKLKEQNDQLIAVLNQNKQLASLLQEVKNHIDIKIISLTQDEADSSIAIHSFYEKIGNAAFCIEQYEKTNGMTLPNALNTFHDQLKILKYKLGNSLGGFYLNHKIPTEIIFEIAKFIDDDTDARNISAVNKACYNTYKSLAIQLFSKKPNLIKTNPKATFWQQEIESNIKTPNWLDISLPKLILNRFSEKLESIKKILCISNANKLPAKIKELANKNASEHEIWMLQQILFLLIDMIEDGQALLEAYLKAMHSVREPHSSYYLPIDPILLENISANVGKLIKTTVDHRIILKNSSYIGELFKTIRSLFQQIDESMNSRWKKLWTKDIAMNTFYDSTEMLKLIRNIGEALLKNDSPESTPVPIKEPSKHSNCLII